MACVQDTASNVHEAAFAMTDRAGAGRLSAEDVEWALASVGHKARPETVQRFVGTDREAYAQLVDKHAASISDNDLVALAFDVFTTEGSNTNSKDGGADACRVSGDALLKGLAKLGFKVTDDDVKELMREFGSDGNGTLSRADLAMLLRAPP
mmetsp:Transcript_87253/g.244878  ORF Transcript_87253/g.244878 Transcript_87253/m.244878 type:complete len:152 (-) Transcript_87253:153-608(-)